MFNNTYLIYVFKGMNKLLENLVTLALSPKKKLTDAKTRNIKSIVKNEPRTFAEYGLGKALMFPTIYFHRTCHRNYAVVWLVS